MFRELAKVLKPGAILASNTSTISITRMAESPPDPSRFVGMHFFYPVDRMELVEVIRGEKTSDETVATIVALAKRVRKTPIVVKDCAGFLVNRVLFPYMNEALLLLAEGASMDAIDKAATKFGMPMGPIALEDLVGLDTACLRRPRHAQGVPRPRGADAGPRRPGEGRPARPEVGGRVPQVRREGEGRGRPGGRRDPARSTRPATTSRPTPRSPTASSWPCSWRRPGRSKRGSSATRPTSTWA